MRRICLGLIIGAAATILPGAAMVYAADLSLNIGTIQLNTNYTLGEYVDTVGQPGSLLGQKGTESEVIHYDSNGNAVNPPDLNVLSPNSASPFVHDYNFAVSGSAYFTYKAYLSFATYNSPFGNYGQTFVSLLQGPNLIDTVAQSVTQPLDRISTTELNAGTLYTLSLAGTVGSCSVNPSSCGSAESFVSFSTSPVGPTVAVPGPIAGAGLPALLALGSALFFVSYRKRANSRGAAEGV